MTRRRELRDRSVTAVPTQHGCATQQQHRAQRMAFAPRLSHITNLCYNINEWTNRLAHGAPRCTTHIPTRSA
jgi:hypothetical protein